MHQRDKSKNLVWSYQRLKLINIRKQVNQIALFYSIAYNYFKSFIQIQEN